MRGTEREEIFIQKGCMRPIDRLLQKSPERYSPPTLLPILLPTVKGLFLLFYSPLLDTSTHSEQSCSVSDKSLIR